MTDTEQTEWRSGDVVVTPDPAKAGGGGYWRVIVPWMDIPAFVLKVLFPDPQLLAEVIDIHQPKPTQYCDTEQTEWRSGDVTVTDYGKNDDVWRVATPYTLTYVSKAIAPDGRALAEFVDSQQPRPRYYAKQWGNDSGEWAVRDRVEKRVVVYGYPADVERIAAALNAYTSTDQ